jgi:hypothetical protein
MPLRAITRLLIGPLLVGLLAGIELRRYGVAAAAAGVYFVFVAAEATVLLWGRYQLRLARRRLPSRRRPRGRA